jgi:hypothetical protein
MPSRYQVLVQARRWRHQSLCPHQRSRAAAPRSPRLRSLSLLQSLLAPQSSLLHRRLRRPQPSHQQYHRLSHHHLSLLYPPRLHLRLRSVSATAVHPTLGPCRTVALRVVVDAYQAINFDAKQLIMVTRPILLLPLVQSKTVSTHARPMRDVLGLSLTGQRRPASFLDPSTSEHSPRTVLTSTLTQGCATTNRKAVRPS